MASMNEDSLTGVMGDRVRLEENAARLRKVLQHWQTWEAEYEGLREQIRSLPEGAGREELTEACSDLEFEFVTEKEIKELLRDKNNSRSASQVDALLGRRLDYVQRNVISLEKQIDAMEFQVASATVSSGQDGTTDDSLRLTEILEELDEDGFVFSSRVSHPGDIAPEVLETLKKAGVKHGDVLDGVGQGMPQASAVQSAGIGSKIINAVSTPIHDATSTTSVSAKPSSTTHGKSVSFANDTKEALPLYFKPVPPALSLPGDLLTSNQGALSPAGKSNSNSSIYELNDEDQPISVFPPIMPIVESPEEAALRREMLAYTMSEVGSIVAQLDLEEESSQGSDQEVEKEVDDDDEARSMSSAEEEDQYGISATRGLTDKYRTEMLEMERRLNARMFENVEPSGNSSHAASAEEPSKLPVREMKPTEKTVRFADALDVAPHPDVLPTSPPMSRPMSQRPVTAVKDNISERLTPSFLIPTTKPTSPQPQKPSRFKASRKATTTPLSSFQAFHASKSSTNPSPTTTTTSRPRPVLANNTPLAPFVTEHPPVSLARSASPSEFEPALLRHEIATEYYRHRNRLIMKEGGFSRKRQEAMMIEEEVRREREREGQGGNLEKGRALGGVFGVENEDEEDEEAEEDEDEEGYAEEEEEPPRKMSLFKAARLKREFGR